MNLARRILAAVAVHRRKTVALVVLIAVLTGLFFFRYATLPIGDASLVRIVDIPKGSGFFRITEILKDAGLVHNRPFFWTLAIVKGAAKTIRAGEYELTGSMSPAQIIEKLVRGEIKSYWVTLPEDITMNEIAKRLTALNLINEREFFDLGTDRSFLASLGIEAESIEGYLFPETYQLNRSMTTREVVRIIVRQFWKGITPEMSKRAEQMGFTLHEWVTLASLIGKEAGNREEKTLISAVFHNRLAQGMRLQSDPTAVYHLEKEGTPVKTIRRKHLALDSPYNTYRINGLPPGPIANPGVDSLRAALHPDRVGYLYFVSTNDGSHHFSTTLDAHRKAVAKYQINKRKK
ncbi:MAG: endolytic transglycosylase MltG [Thermodesulfobacteriota bacterium]